jgi:hypothetical protein
MTRGFRNYAVEMDRSGMTYITSFIKTGLDIQVLMRGTHRQQGDLISLFMFFQNKGSVSYVINNLGPSIVAVPSEMSDFVF